MAKEVFLRQSSGLVRDVSPWSSMLANWALVTGGTPLLIISWLWLAPGANWTLAYLITLVPTLGMAFLYYVAASSMPRAGADYVFNSRAIHPAVGFANYWGLFIAFVLSQGFYSYLGASWIGYLFTGLGLYYHSSYLLSIGSFFTSKIGKIAWGLLVGTLITSLIAFSTRFHWRFILITGIISVVANIIMFIALLQINPSAFSNVLSSFSGITNATQNVISYAKSNGLSFYPAIYATLLASPAVWYYYSWYNVPASWSGEMKKVRINVFLSIVVAIILSAIYYILFTQINLSSFGSRFLDSYSYLYYKKCCCGLSIANPLICKLSNIGNFTPFFALLMLGNPILYIIMFIAIWLPNYYSGPPLVVGLSRYLFSWSFDRIMPSWMADVDERFNAPVKSIILITILSALGVIMYAYLPILSLVDVTVAFEISYAIFALSVALMPFIKKQLFNNAVIVRKRILGIPAISLIGFSTFGFLVYITYITWGNPVLLPVNMPTILSLILMYGSGFAIYYIAKIINSKKGVDVGLVFKEIPPE